jgi:hypothetical protein
MKRNRLIFYGVFGILILLILIFSLYVDFNSHNGKELDISFLFGLVDYIWIPKYCSLTLLILFATNVVLHMRDNQQSKKIIDAQQREITELKAKLYDKSQSTKVPAPGV